MRATLNGTAAQRLFGANGRGKEEVNEGLASAKNPRAGTWDDWRARFEEHGCTTRAPGWPDDPEPVEEAKPDPEVFAHKRQQQAPSPPCKHKQSPDGCNE